MLGNINYHIWFNVARPIKLKYKLVTNATLVLNCACVIQEVTNKGFTLRSLGRYARYYNSEKIKYYVSILISGGFIVQSGNYNSHPLYSLSPLGIQVMKELNESYDKQLVLFCSKYNIEL